MSGLPLGTRPCRHCGQQIAWVVINATGNRLPIDPTTNTAGNVFVSYTNGKLGAVVAKRGDAVSGLPFMPHFATCPVLNKHKATKKATAAPTEPAPEQFTLDL